MKKISWKIFAASLVILLTANALSAETENEPNPDYKKTLAIGTNVLGFLLLGPVGGLEYTGLGNIGIFGYYTVLSQNSAFGAFANMYDTKISGSSLFGGLKYYYSYDKKFHDSGYIALAYTWGNYKFSHKLIPDRYLELGINTPWIMVGWRWQWSVIFIDFMVGTGFAKVSAKVGGGFPESDRNDIEKSSSGITYGGNLGMGIAF